METTKTNISYVVSPCLDDISKCTETIENLYNEYNEQLKQYHKFCCQLEKASDNDSITTSEQITNKYNTNKNLKSYKNDFRFNSYCEKIIGEKKNKSVSYMLNMNTIHNRNIEREKEKIKPLHDRYIKYINSVIKLYTDYISTYIDGIYTLESKKKQFSDRDGNKLLTRSLVFIGYSKESYPMGFNQRLNTLHDICSYVDTDSAKKQNDFILYIAEELYRDINKTFNYTNSDKYAVECIREGNPWANINATTDISKLLIKAIDTYIYRDLYHFDNHSLKYNHTSILPNCNDVFNVLCILREICKIAYKDMAYKEVLYLNQAEWYREELYNIMSFKECRKKFFKTRCVSKGSEKSFFVNDETGILARMQKENNFSDLRICTTNENKFIVYFGDDSCDITKYDNYVAYLILQNIFDITKKSLYIHNRYHDKIEIIFSLKNIEEDNRYRMYPDICRVKITENDDMIMDITAFPLNDLKSLYFTIGMIFESHDGSVFSYCDG